MKNGLVFLFTLWCALVCVPLPEASAQTNAEDAKLATEERDGCSRNLKLIYTAIQAYQADHKQLPNWLSDLVPQYLSDANVLICPVSKRTGEMESSPLADPKIPSSYLFEFCPVPLGQDLPGDPTKTRREWKRREMGLVGSSVPIVRCYHHAAWLNLAFDGRIYDSQAWWEQMFSKQVDPVDLMPSRIFMAETISNPAAQVSKYPARDPQARPGQIDLSAYYNVGLTETWHGKLKNDLASLPTGLQTFGGHEYDVRGMILLSGRLPALQAFPEQVTGIQIHQKCERLHFLHASTFGSNEFEGKQVGAYILHFATNSMQLEIPIIYGKDVRDWYASTGEKPDSELTEVWTGTNESAAALHRSLRLFSTTWVNVAPSIEIESIDFVSETNKSPPFLIGITAD